MEFPQLDFGSLQVNLDNFNCHRMLFSDFVDLDYMSCFECLDPLLSSTAVLLEYGFEGLLLDEIIG